MDGENKGKPYFQMDDLGGNTLILGVERLRRWKPRELMVPTTNPPNLGVDPKGSEAKAPLDLHWYLLGSEIWKP